MKERIFIKESVLGTITKKLDYSIYLTGKIQTFCICNKCNQYTGTIPAYKELALISEWENAGFIEVKNT